MKHLKLYEQFRINETGEWVGDEDQIAWMDSLREKVEEIIDLCPEGIVELNDIKGFDNYSGPYAKVSILGKSYKIWTTEASLWVEGYTNPDNTSSEGQTQGYEGQPYRIAEVINAYQKVHQLLSDELDFFTDSSELNYTPNKEEDNHSTFTYQYYMDLKNIVEFEKVLDRFIKKWDIDSYKLEKMRGDDLEETPAYVFINFYIDSLPQWIDKHQ